MKVKLLVDIVIGEKMRLKGAVVDLFQAEAELLIKQKKACSVPDGTMARIVSYDTTGCVPPKK